MNKSELSNLKTTANSSLVDGEVLGRDADGKLIQWNVKAGEPYNSGETLDEFGKYNLSETEIQRVTQEAAKMHDAFNYQLLARLKQDCDYYLGHGNRHKKRLWSGDEVEQIAKMKELFASFREKPQWISLEDIERYEALMVVEQPLV